MGEIVLCSECFNDQKLKLDASNIGFKKEISCPNCKSNTGKKLDKKLVGKLAYRFFVLGTIKITNYGGSPLIKFNEGHYNKSDMNFSKWIEEDVELFEEILEVGFFRYGPRLWMIGEIEPLKSLQKETKRDEIINKIIKKYPEKLFLKEEVFYRLRKNPKHPENFNEYDSPPNNFLGSNRLDSNNLTVMYGSQDLEVCIHECRVTIEDDIYVAAISPIEDLKLLDLTKIVDESLSELQSIDMAVHMLFLASEHSYKITREIALAAYENGFDGVIYPSYFSLIRTGAVPFNTVYGISVRKFSSYKNHAESQMIPNIALFGRPIKEKTVKVESINRLILEKVKYDFHFGPVEY